MSRTSNTMLFLSSQICILGMAGLSAVGFVNYLWPVFVGPLDQPAESGMMVILFITGMVLAVLLGGAIGLLLWPIVTWPFTSRHSFAAFTNGLLWIHIPLLSGAFSWLCRKLHST